MQQKLSVLLVDDEPDFLSSMAERIQVRGIEPFLAKNGSQALKIAQSNSLDLAIVDLRLPDIDGVTLIDKLNELQTGLQVVLLTGHGEDKIRQACKAMDAQYFEKDDMGSFWKFIKQFRSKTGLMLIAPPGFGGQWSPDDLEARFDRLAPSPEDMRTWDVGPETSNVQKPRILGATPVMQEVKNSIAKVAALDCAVLIRGETGTGKELVSRAIHTKSSRRKGKFLAINCSAFGQDLLNNELFGYERETFSGSVRIKKGLFESAEGGTILLDEICEAPATMQTHLLRVLEDKMIIRSGGTEEIPVDVRILAATNQCLDERMESGQFRRDLYYRLNTFVLRLPPLRDRKEDIPLLANYFLGKYRKEFGKKIDRISNEAMQILIDYSFPGNVRDLEHALERAIIICDGQVILPEHLPQRFGDNHQPAIRDEQESLVSLAELEKDYIREVLKSTGGNRNEAANILGISRTSLWRKLKDDE